MLFSLFQINTTIIDQSCLLILQQNLKSFGTILEYTIDYISAALIAPQAVITQGYKQLQIKEGVSLHKIYVSPRDVRGGESMRKF